MSGWTVFWVMVVFAPLVLFVYLVVKNPERKDQYATIFGTALAIVISLIGGALIFFACGACAAFA